MSIEPFKSDICQAIHVKYPTQAARWPVETLRYLLTFKLRTRRETKLCNTKKGKCTCPFLRSLGRLRKRPSFTSATKLVNLGKTRFSCVQLNMGRVTLKYCYPVACVLPNHRNIIADILNTYLICLPILHWTSEVYVMALLSIIMQK